MLKRQSILIAINILVLLLAGIFDTNGAADKALHGCSERCGDLTVPYPFGIEDGCHLEDKFKITCENSTGTPKAFLARDKINVTHISLDDAELQVLQSIVKSCYGQYGVQMSNFSLSHSDFTISATKNKFTAVGCDTIAVLDGYAGGKWKSTGCFSLCETFDSINFGPCSGAGCCQIIETPEGLQNFTLAIVSPFNHSFDSNFSPCSYAFLAEERQFKFSKTTFKEFKNKAQFPLILDWTVSNFTCNEARRLGNLPCKQNSECVNSRKRSGYLCRCLAGYEGNPYHPDGCQGKQ